MGRKAVDIKGQRFSRLLVLERYIEDTPGRNAKWKCICDCGKEIITVGTNLRTGHTKSCGCLVSDNMREVGKKQGKNNIIDLIGQTFTYLTVIERKDSKWLCECKCGAFAEVKADKLISGHTKSCGCLRSYQELIIGEILSKLNVSFKREYIFEDCVNPETDYKLRFDFAIFQNGLLKCLIEYQGKQHYLGWSNNGESLKDIQYKDQLKVDYCKENSIPLYILNKDFDIEEAIIDITNRVTMSDEEI